MSDLSNLLGDVYGDHSSPDAAPVRHEPAAFDRIPAAPAYEAPAPAPMPVFTAPAPAPAPAPMPTVDLTAAPAPLPSYSVSAPVPAMAGGSQWATGDDDIFPSGKGAKKKK